MKLLGWLLRGERPQPVHERLEAEIVALKSRVALLDEQQLRRELEWAEVAEKLKRYLQRISAVEQRARDREGGHADPVVAAVLKSKFPRQNGG